MEQRSRARGLYSLGRDREAGHAIANTVPAEDQPSWAGHVLGVVARGHAVPEVVRKVIEVAYTPSRWPEGRPLFDDLRQLTLRAERNPFASRRAKALLGVAEIVAQLSYNAGGGPHPYDKDTASWLPGSVRYFVEAARSDFERDELLTALFLVKV